MKYIKLFENIKTQNQIEKLSILILSEITNKTILEKKWNLPEFLEYRTKYSIFYFIDDFILSDLSIKNKGFDEDFKFFITDKYRKTNISCQYKNGRVSGSHFAEKRFPGQEFQQLIDIKLYYNDNIISDFLSKFNNDYDNLTYDILLNFLNKRKSTLIHELQHSYDEWRSRGKYKNKHVSLPDELDDVEYLNKWKEYTKTSHEISAFFTNTISDLFDNYKDSFGYPLEIHNWDDVYDAFINKFPNWEGQTDDVKKRLTQRLYHIWDEKQGKRKLPHVDISDKIEKLEEQLKEKYGLTNIYIFYNDFQNTIQVNTMKVNSIDDEKYIYKKLIFLADIYRKTIILNLVQGYTTVSIKDAKKYLKEFGFIYNRGNKKLSEIDEEYFRESKRKD